MCNRGYKDSFVALIRKPLVFKTYPNQKVKVKLNLKEALEMHREIKTDILDLLAKANQPNMTKQTVMDELFKIYTKVK